MYLIIDEQHRVYQAPIVSGYVRSQVKQGNLSIINTRDMTGMAITGEWEDVQLLPIGFRIDDDNA